MNKNIDIKNLKVAKKYTQALVEVTTNSIDKTYEDLTLVKEVIFDNQEFKTFFLHPVISLKDKKETIKESLGKNIDEKVLNFLETLLDENRLNIFNTIFELFKVKMDEIKNKQKINVISAIDLDDEDKQNLINKLNEKLSKEVILDCQKDENIIGGLVLKLNDKIVDLSLKTKFNNLKKN